jgi:hypothetical protein
MKTHPNCERLPVSDVRIRQHAGLQRIVVRGCKGQHQQREKLSDN